MPVDTRGFRAEHIGKRLRIKLQNGDVNEVKLLELTVCDEPEPCCGITYRLLLSGSLHGQHEPGKIYWTAFHEIENFQVLETESHGTV